MDLPPFKIKRFLTITSIKDGEEHLKNKHHDQYDNRRDDASFGIATKIPSKMNISKTNEEEKIYW